MQNTDYDMQIELLRIAEARSTHTIEKATLQVAIGQLLIASELRSLRKSVDALAPTES